MSEESLVLAGILMLSLVAVESGGLYLLKVVRGRADATPFQETPRSRPACSTGSHAAGWPSPRS